MKHSLPNGREIEVFFDGACPLCRREMDLMRRLDRGARVQFTDIAGPGFDPARFGLTQADFMEEIRGRLHDGTLIKGVEVFRRLYAAIGWRWLAAVSRWPGVRQTLEIAYRVFARNRLRMTGRCDAECRIPAGVQPATKSAGASA